MVGEVEVEYKMFGWEQFTWVDSAVRCFIYSSIFLFFCLSEEETIFSGWCWMRKNTRHNKKDDNIVIYCTFSACPLISINLNELFGFSIVSKVGDCSQGRPEGSLFNSYYAEV